MTARRFGALVWSLSAATLFAHGDLHEQIQELSVQIERQPEGAGLHFRRGELHRVHGSPAAAAADYDQAERLDPEMTAVHLGRGYLLLAAGQFEEAVSPLNRFLEAHPGHQGALVARARAQSGEGRHLAAAEDYARIIELSAQPELEHYLEHAAALTAAGPGHAGAALKGLEAGIAKLGNALMLNIRALELEMLLKRHDAALARIDRMTAGTARQEFWLERRGDVLEQAGRLEEARQTFEAALKAARSHPPQIRSRETARRLEARLQRKLLEEKALEDP